MTYSNEVKKNNFYKRVTYKNFHIKLRQCILEAFSLFYKFCKTTNEFNVCINLVQQFKHWLDKPIYLIFASINLS